MITFVAVAKMPPRPCLCTTAPVQENGNFPANPNNPPFKKNMIFAFVSMYVDYQSCDKEFKLPGISIDLIHHVTEDKQNNGDDK